MSNNNDILNNYEKSIVKISTLEGLNVGTGFIVTNDGIICTCFHNVGNLDNKEIYNDIFVFFPRTNQSVKATILKDEQNLEYVDTINDISFLQIGQKDHEELKNKGEELNPLPLSIDILRTHKFISHGFRKSDEFKLGLGSNGDIQGLTKYQTDLETEIPIIQLSSNKIEEGMSGSPVLDIETKKVIGMLDMIYDKNDITDPDLVMAIPVESMISLYKNLSEKNPNLKISEGILNQQNSKIVQTKLVFKGEKTLFVGREEETNNISKLLRNESIISIVGQGGIGKSSFIFHAVKKNRDLFNTIIHIEINPKLNYEKFLDILEDNILLHKFKQSDEDARTMHLMTELSKLGKTLLLLDNFENISINFSKNNPSLDIKKIVNFLESVPSDITLLITSRIQDNLKREYSFQLEGLKKTEGVKLFLDITKKYYKEFPNSSFLKEVENIITSIDGHPLAIKLLACSYKGGGISELNSLSRELIKIRNNLELEKRFSSIEFCFDYSFNRLLGKQKEILVLLSIFDSPFLKETAISVANINGSIIDNLYNLGFLKRFDLDLNIELKENLWFFAFHPLIKQYLIKKSIKLTKLNFELYLRKLAHHYFDFILVANSQIGKEKHTYYSSIIETIIKNSDNDLERIINYIPNLQNRSLYCNNLGLVLMKLRYNNKGLVFHIKCLSYDKDNSKRWGNDYKNIGNYYFFALAYFDHRFYEDALKYYKLALQSYKQDGDKHKKAICRTLVSIANTLMELERENDALKFLIEADDINKELKNEKSSILIKNSFAYYYQRKNNLPKSLGCLQEVLKLDEILDDQTKIALDHKNLGLIYEKLNELDEALKHYLESKSLYSGLKDIVGQKNVCEKLITLYLIKDPSKVKEYTELYPRLVKEIREKNLTDVVYDIY